MLPAESNPADGDSSSPLRFVYLGQVRSDKGVDDIVEAATQLLAEEKHFKIVIAGPITGWGRDTFAPQIVDRVRAQPGLAAVVSFRGYVENVDRLFGENDIHLAPSKIAESYGLVVVEAKRNARASIIYPSGGMVELVEHGNDGWICESKSAGHLKAAMAHFIDRPGEARTMGENALRSLERLRLSKQHFTRQWLEVIGAAGQGEVGRGRRPQRRDIVKQA